MHKNKYSLFALLVMSFFATTFCFADITDPISGTVYPSVISAQGSGGKAVNLTVTGATTRKKLLFSVYSIAHYMQTPPSAGADALNVILQDNQVKQFNLVWLRDIPGKSITEGFLETLKETLGKNMGTYNPQINQFLACFKGGVKKGNSHSIRWLPGSVIVVESNGKQLGQVSSPGFAAVVWNIWFGSANVIDKSQLISQLP